MSLSQHLLEFRKSLFADLDEAFLKASNNFLNNVIADMVIQNNKNYGEILNRLENLEHSTYNNRNNINNNYININNPTTSNKHTIPTIPELFGTNANLNDVIPYSDVEENMSHENDEELYQGEVQEDVDLVEGDDEQGDSETTGEVVDDDTQPPEENDGEAYDADEDTQEEKAQEQEEEGESLQELEVDGETYYYDSAGNVYKADENGEVGEPVGTYDENTGEFDLFASEEEATETLEPFTYKGKSYLKDSEDNVYLEDGSETNFRFVGGKMVRKA